jgi:hypothetical protein
MSDGSLLSPSHLAFVQAEVRELVQLQAIVDRSGVADKVVLLAQLLGSIDSGRSSGEIVHSVRGALLRSAVDVNDALKKGVVESVDVKLVGPESFRRTPRGKIPAIWIEDDRGAYDVLSE